MVLLITSLYLSLASENDQTLGLLTFNHMINISIALNPCIRMHKMLHHSALHCSRATLLDSVGAGICYLLYCSVRGRFVRRPRAERPVVYTGPTSAGPTQIRVSKNKTVKLPLDVQFDEQWRRLIYFCAQTVTACKVFAFRITAQN